MDPPKDEDHSRQVDLGATISGGEGGLSVKTELPPLSRGDSGDDNEGGKSEVGRGGAVRKAGANGFGLGEDTGTRHPPRVMEALDPEETFSAPEHAKSGEPDARDVPDKTEQLPPESKGVQEAKVEEGPKENQVKDPEGGATHGTIQVPDAAAALADAIEQPNLLQDSQSLRQLTLLDPDHPLLSRVQDIIKERLLEAHRRLDLELFTKENELKKTTREREDAGVKLYELQQHLNRTQEKLESVASEFDEVETKKCRRDEKLAGLKQDLNAKKDTAKSAAQKMEALRVKSQDAEQRVRRHEVIKADAEARLKASSASATRAEKDNVALVAKKARQDYWLFELSRRVKNAETRKSELQKELERLRADGSTVRQDLQEVEGDLGVVYMDMKRIQEYWKTGVVGLQQRETMIISLNESLAKATDRLSAEEIETRSMRNRLKDIEEELGGFEERIRHLDAESSVAQIKIEKTINRLETERERAQFLLNALTEMEAERNSLERNRMALQRDLEALGRKYTDVFSKKRELKKELERELARRVGKDLEIKGVTKEGQALDRSIEEKQKSIDSLSSELWRLRTEIETARQRISQSELTLRDFCDNLKARHSELDQKKAETECALQKLEKDQKTVDSLNHKIADALSVQEKAGLLEYEVHSLENSIVSTKNEAASMARLFLRIQSSLVSTSRESDRVVATVHDARLKLNLSHRRQRRLQVSLESGIKQVHASTKSITRIRVDTERLNRLVHVVTVKIQTVKERCFDKNMEYQERYKDRKNEIDKTKQSVEKMKSLKMATIEGLSTTEKDILSAERNLKVAQDTKAFLIEQTKSDSAMSLESKRVNVHRLENKKHDLERRKEQMVQELEKSVVKRDSIETKIWSRKKNRTAIEREILELVKQIEASRNATRYHQLAADELEISLSEYAAQFSEIVSSVRSVELAVRHSTLAVQWALYEKDKVSFSLSLVRTKRKSHRTPGNEEEVKRAMALMQDWLATHDTAPKDRREGKTSQDAADAREDNETCVGGATLWGRVVHDLLSEIRVQ